MASSQYLEHSLVNGKHDREHGGEVGRGLKENATLVKGLADKLVLLIVEFKDGLLEVADASMDELCRLG
jgi:hypothetical protein